jgi:hypothetical protein
MSRAPTASTCWRFRPAPPAARSLADGPILPDPRPSFDDLAVALLPNLDVAAPGSA